MKNQIQYGCLLMLALAQTVSAEDKGGGPHRGGKQGAVASTPTAKIQHFKTTVSAVDLDGKTLKLKSLDGGKEASVVIKDTTPIIKSGKRIKLSDIKEGDSISVSVEEKDGSAFARSISVESSAKGGDAAKSTSDKPASRKE